MTAAAPEGGGDGCRKLHQEIYDLHNDAVSLYKRAELLDGSANLTIANHFRYALRLYLDANRYSLGLEEANADKEKKLLLEAHYQLLVLHHDLIDSVEAKFRKTFYLMMRLYGAEAVGLHVNIPEFHRDLSEVDKIIEKSRRERGDRHALYLKMAQVGGFTDKMLGHLKLLIETEHLIRADARKLALKNPWLVGIVLGLLGIVLGIAIADIWARLS